MTEEEVPLVAGMEREVLLSVREVSKVYSGREGDIEAIAHLDFEINRGEFVCIVGPSGCGKTTLLRTISGLLEPSGGRIELDGQRIDGPPETMALVFQDYSRSLYPWMKVKDNVAFPLRRRRLGKEKETEIVSHALESVGLGEYGGYYPWQLSGGMQQRVAIARGLAYEPEILLMDEPFAAVDAQTRIELEDLVLRLQAEYGITVIFVTHDIDEAVYMADRVIVLTQRPASVKEELAVTLPKPRDQIATKQLPEFATLRAHVFSQIMNQQALPGEG